MADARDGFGLRSLAGLLLGEAGGLGASDVVQELLAGGDILIVVLFHFFAQRGEAVEEQLAKVGQGDGVASGNAFASELFDEIAEEEIHGTGGGEVIDFREEIGGEKLRVDRGNIGAKAAGVVGAERRAFRAICGTLTTVNQHVTAVAFGADVPAKGIDGGAS